LTSEHCRTLFFCVGSTDRDIKQELQTPAASLTRSRSTFRVVIIERSVNSAADRSNNGPARSDNNSMWGGNDRTCDNCRTASGDAAGAKHASRADDGTCFHTAQGDEASCHQYGDNQTFHDCSPLVVSGWSVDHFRMFGDPMRNRRRPRRDRPSFRRRPSSPAEFSMNRRGSMGFSHLANTCAASE
jgi:hypothetical protein